jgi:phospholipid/cholesterol/gamma-HCH transport system substrate-binding protein
MAKALHWKDLKTGILALSLVVLVAVGVLTFGRVGTLHGKTFEVYVTTDAARGVIRGTEVWLDGQKVGLVRDVSFQAPTSAQSERLVLKLRILQSAQEHLRLDSRFQVRAGTSVIGDQVVYISSGTAKMRQVAAGDTIHSHEGQTDYESVSADAAEASKELPAIMANVKVLTAQLQTASGTLGAFGVDQGGAEMQRLRARMSRVMSRLSGGDGSIALAMNNSDLLFARAKRAMAQTDSLRALLASNDNSLGRFRRDSTIMGVASRLRGELGEIQRLAASPNGTIGRIRADSAIIHAVHRDLAALDSLIADMKKHPLRYNPF